MWVPYVRTVRQPVSRRGIVLQADTLETKPFQVSSEILELPSLKLFGAPCALGFRLRQQEKQ